LANDWKDLIADYKQGFAKHKIAFVFNDIWGDILMIMASVMVAHEMGVL